MKNTKRLGWRQKAMLDFMDRHAERYCDPFRTYSIHKDERSVALSLQERGLIRIVNDCLGNWQVVRA